MVGFVELAVGVAASETADLVVLKRGSGPVATLDYEGCCSYVDSSSSVVGLVALSPTKVVRASVVLVIEDHVHSWPDLEHLPASDSYRVAVGSSTDLMPLPLPLPLLDPPRFRTLVACLQALHIEDNPWSGASDLVVVETDNELALVMAEWEMLAFDAVAAYETEGRLGR
jgi:hypothetical protein